MRHMCRHMPFSPTFTGLGELHLILRLAPLGCLLIHADYPYFTVVCGVLHLQVGCGNDTSNIVDGMATQDDIVGGVAWQNQVVNHDPFYKGPPTKYSLHLHISSDINFLIGESGKAAMVRLQIAVF